MRSWPYNMHMVKTSLFLGSNVKRHSEMLSYSSSNNTVLHSGDIGSVLQYNGDLC